MYDFEEIKITRGNKLSNVENPLNKGALLKMLNLS